MRPYKFSYILCKTAVELTFLNIFCVWLLCVLCAKCIGRALWSCRVCLSVCTVGWTREPLDGLRWNFVWKLCCSARPNTCTFEYPTSGDNKVTDEAANNLEDKHLHRQIWLTYEQECTSVDLKTVQNSGPAEKEISKERHERWTSQSWRRRRRFASANSCSRTHFDCCVSLQFHLNVQSMTSGLQDVVPASMIVTSKASTMLALP